MPPVQTDGAVLPFDATAALVGVQQLGLEGVHTEAEIDLRTRHMLSRALNTRRVVAVVGSGVSAGYGYPRWDDLATDLVKFTLDPARPSQETPQHREARELLSSFLREPASLPARADRTAASPLARADRIVLILDLCEELCANAIEPTSPLRKEAARIIAERATKVDRTMEPDPLAVVMKELGIRRFLTTNYDDEIQLAFQRVLGTSPQRLTIEGVRSEDLVQFAVAAPGFETGVFHLHGVADHPPSMVVTERDYQLRYLQDDPEHRAYREALRLAFAANPVLFLGASMEEPDLLRPLREFVSERHRDPRERPLFALLPRPAEVDAAIEKRRFLYTRYGVKVVYYRVRPEDEPRDAFCNAVKGLARGWTTWWQSWQCKPVVREAKFGTRDGGKTMIRHYTKQNELSTQTDDYKKVVGALETLGECGGAVVALGDAGAGKGGLGIRLVEDPALLGRYEKRFFATMHFTNDFLSAVDAIAGFLGADAKTTDPENKPKTPFARALCSGRHLIVIGGLERVLALTPPPGARALDPHRGASGYPLPLGQPLTPEVEDFLQAIVDLAAAGEKGHSHVVLTSAVWPLPLQQSRVKEVPLGGISLVGASELFATLEDEELAHELCHTLRGHVYALWLLEGVLPRMERDYKPWIKRLVARLSALELTRRPEVAVEEVIAWAVDKEARDRATRAGKAAKEAGKPDKEVDEAAKKAGDWAKDLLRSVLKRVSLFATPVGPATVQTSCALTDEDAGEAGLTVAQALECLADHRLLLPVFDLQTSEKIRYTAHTVVRAHVLHSLGSLPDVPGEPQRFELSGFSSEASEAQPGTPPGMKLTTESVEALLASGSRDPAATSDRADVRAAFSLMRARWTATAIGRLAPLELERSVALPRPHTDAYLRRLALLLNAVRAASPGHWRRETEGRERLEHEKGILYADELAWLYNELGLACFCQGSEYDAYALFRMGQDVNAVAERTTYGHRWCESEINLALVQTERARLSRARYHLDNAIGAALRLRDGQIEARARGHLGLVHHLGGDYVQADKLYSRALKMVRRTGNRRAASIFHRHRGDLRRLQGQMEAAADDIRASIAAAESGRHPDLLHYARVAEANLILTEGGRSRLFAGASPQKLLLPALEFARKVGLPKLEADARSVQAAIALQQGETDFAGRLATRCLALAAGLGMQLRVTSALVVTGQVAKARGHWSAAHSLFRSVIRLAERQGYQLQIERAEREIMEMGWQSESQAGKTKPVGASSAASASPA